MKERHGGFDAAWADKASGVIAVLVLNGEHGRMFHARSLATFGEQPITSDAGVWTRVTFP